MQNKFLKTENDYCIYANLKQKKDASNIFHIVILTKNFNLVTTIYGDFPTFSKLHF